MSQDGPARSGGHRFGYHAHLDAGAIPKPVRSAGQMNLEAFLTRHPQLRARASEMMAAGHRAQTIIKRLREGGGAERYRVRFYRRSSDVASLAPQYLEDLGLLRASAQTKVRNKLHARAVIEQVIDGEWQVIEQILPA